MDLTPNVAFHAIELAGERHADATENGTAGDVAVVEAQLARLDALYRALDALNDDDRALLVEGAERAARTAARRA